MADAPLRGVIFIPPDITFGVFMAWLLEMKNITKTFGAVKAVDNVSLRLNAGEVVSLCGENGSGNRR
jgi:ABC-type phosphonate transport system ATPase subunit